MEVMEIPEKHLKGILGVCVIVSGKNRRKKVEWLHIWLKMTWPNSKKFASYF